MSEAIESLLEETKTLPKRKPFLKVHPIMSLKEFDELCPEQ